MDEGHSRCQKRRSSAMSVIITMSRAQRLPSDRPTLDQTTEGS